MAGRALSFCEVPLNLGSQQRWKELTVNLGGVGNQDIKLPERGGGFSYKDGGRVGAGPACNRLIYWRSYGDTLELVELSGDANLEGNAVRIRFPDTAVVPCVGIHETHAHVVVLLATVGSVHRIVLPHPSRIARMDYGGYFGIPSVFADLSLAELRNENNFHLLNQSPSNYPHLGATWLTNEGKLSLPWQPLGKHLIGIVTEHELRQASMMQRLWTGWVPSVIRGGQESSDATLDLCVHRQDSLGHDNFVFAVCRDHKLRMWSTNDQECVAEADLLDFVADKIDQQTAPGQSHMIQKTYDSQTHSLYLVAFLSFADRSMFVVVQPVLEDGRYHFLHMATLCSPQEKLISLHLDPSTLWTVWTNRYDETVARYCSIESGPAGQQGWSQVILEPAVSPEVTVPNHQDPSEAYLEHIFYPGRFSLQTIAKALHIYRRAVDVIADLSAAVLKEQVALVVETEIQNAVTEYEVQQEEYYQIQLQCWNKFYLCCTQYHQVAARPLGVYSDEDTAMVCLVKKGAVSFLRPCDGVEHLYLSPQGVCQPQHLSTAPLNIADEKLCRDVVLLGDCLRLIQDQLTPDVVSAVEQDSVDFSLCYEKLCRDVVLLGDCLRLIRDQLTPDVVSAVEQDLYHLETPQNIVEPLQDLYHLETPQNIVEPLVNNVISEAGDVDQSSAEVISTLESSLQTIIDAPRAIDTVLQAMDVTGGDPENLACYKNAFPAGEPLRQLSLNHVFGSAAGHAVLETSARGLATTRLAICRDLLLLQGLMGRMGQRASLSQDSLNKLQSDLIPRTAQLMQVYYVIAWVSTATYTHIPSTSLDMNLRQLQTMDISDLGTGLPRYLMTEGSLLALFLHGVGGQQLGSLLAGSAELDQDPCPLWSGVLQTAVLYILQLLYPMSPSSLLPEFLMTKCQYLQLQEYVRLLDSWCVWNRSMCVCWTAGVCGTPPEYVRLLDSWCVWNTSRVCAPAGQLVCVEHEYVRLLDSWCVWNTSSRRFFLGAAHLNCGEPHKAVDCFLQGVHGVGNEDFLLNKLLQPTDQELEHLPVLYLVKVLRLLEQFEVPELVISLANSAIGMAQPDDPNIPMLWSKVFKYHLELGHNNEAYAAMTANPDHTRRKDCLRQFIVVLCERSQLQTLVEFPYVGLHDEVVYIIESRARSVDLTAHNYYDLLYAFHIYRGSYRKAGSTMYEYGLRLGRELPGVKSLQKQAKCYLAAINTLRLVDPKYAWIVKPVRVETATEEGRVSPKRDYTGDRRLPDKKKQVEILELSELEKEYMVVLARLHLIQRDPDPAHATGMYMVVLARLHLIQRDPDPAHATGMYMVVLARLHLIQRDPDPAHATGMYMVVLARLHLIQRDPDPAHATGMYMVVLARLHLIQRDPDPAHATGMYMVVLARLHLIQRDPDPAHATGMYMVVLARLHLIQRDPDPADATGMYMVVLARLHLIQRDPDPAHATGPPLSAEETVALLVQAGLFDNAVSLSQAFKLSLVPVFEGLASKCVRLTLSGPDIPKVGGKKEGFDWLGANDIPFTHTSKPITAADQAWQLLQAYLERFDITGVKGYHKSVANKLLSLGAPLPTWLVRAYKEKNASELLRLYLNFDLLEEACHLVGEYIDAVLGKGTEYFGLKSALHATSPSVWLPYTAIDHLLYTLRTAEGNHSYAKLHLDLSEKLSVYHRNVERVSRDMVQSALQKAARHARQDTSFNLSSYGRT
ncbi:hypothetical protein Bbelb_093680 [Branchiostoma belcheri]|nr:hypothetical protein Bbelb_093680 [Branchiostoma belcheri]